MSKNTRNRILLTAVAALLLVVMAVGGTVAYLQASTSEVKNTFSPSNIAVTLDEHTYNAETNTLTDTLTTTGTSGYKFVPGVNLPKDPDVSTTGTDVAHYVFVKVTEVNWPTTTNISYTLNTTGEDAWTELYASEDGTVTILYQEVAAGNILTDVPVLDPEQITVSSDLMDEEMADLYTDGVAENIALKFQAWAIQMATFENNPTGAYETASGEDITPTP